MRMTVLVALGVLMRSSVSVRVDPVRAVSVEKVRMVVAFSHHPLEEVGRLPRHLLRHFGLVGGRLGVSFEMEVIVQIAVGPTEGENAVLTREGSVVDIGRAPEVYSGRYTFRLAYRP